MKQSFTVFAYLSVFVPLICNISILLFGSTAYSFDPTTVAMGAQAVSGIMGGLDKADEAADLGFSLGDLLSELGLEPEGEGAMKNAVSNLEDLSAKARDLRWSKDDVRTALDYDLKRANSVADKLKVLRNMISVSKRIATIIGVRPKAGEKAAVIQEIRINSMILEELQAMRRAQFLAYLEDRETKARRDIFMQEILEGKSLAPGRRGLDSAGSASSRWDSALPAGGRSSVTSLRDSTSSPGGGL
jgi:hypothetical protein